MTLVRSDWVNEMEDDLCGLTAAQANRVLIHVDLDAFYAQVEIQRLGLDPTVPVAVQQWEGLIAVNYPARKAGITRHMRVGEAKKLCPSLVTVHVETLDENGESRVHAARATDKVSLSRYRTASFAIFKVLLRICGEKSVEKASVDEAYIDVSDMADEYLRSGVVRDKGAGNASSSTTGSAAAAGAGGMGHDGNAGVGQKRSRDGVSSSSTAVSHAERAIHHLSDRDDCFVVTGRDKDACGAAVAAAAASSGDDQAYGPAEGMFASNRDGLARFLQASSPSDARLVAGAMIASHIRAAVWDELHYTCSAGIAHNKMLAKLGSGRNKPNKQTILPSAAVPGLMVSLPLTKIRFLGGKLGAQLVADVIAAGIYKPQVPTSTAASASGAITAVAAPGAGAAAAVAKTVESAELASNSSVRHVDVTSDDALDDDEDLDDLAGDGDTADGDVEGDRIRRPFEPSGAASASSSSALVGPVDPDIAGKITAGDAQKLSSAALRRSFGDEAARWIYRIVRGIDDSEVTPRLRPKSMMAAKSFNNNTCKSQDEAGKWMRMLCAELANRIVDDEALFSRQPRSLVLHYRRDDVVQSRSYGSKSKSGHMPPKPRTSQSLFNVAMGLLKKAVADELSSSAASNGSMFQCSHLALAASNFADGPGAGKDISSFFGTSTAGAGPSGSHSSSAAEVDGRGVDIDDATGGVEVGGVGVASPNASVREVAAKPLPDARQSTAKLKPWAPAAGIAAAFARVQSNGSSTSKLAAGSVATAAASAASGGATGFGEPGPDEMNAELDADDEDDDIVVLDDDGDEISEAVKPDTSLLSNSRVRAHGSSSSAPSSPWRASEHIEGGSGKAHKLGTLTGVTAKIASSSNNLFRRKHGATQKTVSMPSSTATSAAATNTAVASIFNPSALTPCPGSTSPSQTVCPVCNTAIVIPNTSGSIGRLGTAANVHASAINAHIDKCLQKMAKR